MEQPKKNPQEIQIELTPEVASGHYANLAAITHTPGEVFIDFIALTPNMPKAKVQSRIIMTPENAKNLLFALTDNIRKYEAVQVAMARSPIHSWPDRSSDQQLRYDKRKQSGDL